MANTSLLRATLGLFAANLPFLLLAYGQVVVIGAHIGVSRQYDLFLLAWIIPELLLFGLGNILQMHCLPWLHKIEQNDGGVVYWQATWALLIWMAAAVVLLVAILFLSANGLLSLILPTLSPVEAGQAASLLRALLITLGAMALVKILGALHRASHSMRLNAISQSAIPVAVMLWLWLMPQWQVWALWSGMTLGAIIQVLLLAPAPLKWGRGLHRPAWWHPMFKDLVRRLPLLFVVAVGFRLILAGNRLVASSLDPGSVAILRYVVFVLLAALNLVTMPFLSVVFNRLSYLAGNRQWGESVELGLKALEMFWGALLPLGFGLALFAGPIAKLILGWGVVQEHDILRTAAALRLFAPVVPLAGWYFISLAVHTARRRYGFPFVLGILIPLVNLGLGFLLCRKIGLMGIALATDLCLLGWVLLLGKSLYTRASRQRIIRFGDSLLRTFGATLAAGAVVFFISDGPAQSHEWLIIAGQAGLFVLLLGAGFVGICRNQISGWITFMREVKIGR